MEVGEQYFAAWIYSSQTGWSLLSVRTLLPVDDYGRPQRHEWTEPSLASEAFVGALPEQISKILSGVGPYPHVSKYAYLEPLARRVAVDLDHLPDRPGFLKATREKFGGQLGYVREEDWERLQREQDPALDVPFYDEKGNQSTADEGGGITLDGFVLE